MERAEIKPIIESLIFVSEEPISIDLMAMVLEESGISKSEICEAMEEIKNDCNESPLRGIHLVEVAGGYQFRTKPFYADWIQRLNIPKPIRLSQQAMETLSIIAYRQPIFRSDIENIRGVDSGGVLKTLLEKELVRIIGKSDEVGHPLVYGTTKAFLEMFSLNSLKDLPTLKEVEGLEIEERVGDLSRAEVNEDGIGEGVSEVIEEYKGEITAYTPDPVKEDEDNRSINDLENSIKHLRKLEKVIFPKPVEEIQAIPREPGADAPESNVLESDVSESGDSSAEGTTNDETTPPQDTGTSD